MTAGGESAEELVVRRLIPVPREQVFAAWLDPASLALWMGPGGHIVRATAEVDPRVGGAFRITMIEADDTGHEHRGEYLAIEPPSLLSFTWISASTDGKPSTVTVELREQGTSTELTLTHRRLPASKVEGHRKGWAEIVRKLEEVISTPRSGDHTTHPG